MGQYAYGSEAGVHVSELPYASIQVNDSSGCGLRCVCVCMCINSCTTLDVSAILCC